MIRGVDDVQTLAPVGVVGRDRNRNLVGTRGNPRAGGRKNRKVEYACDGQTRTAEGHLFIWDRASRLDRWDSHGDPTNGLDRQSENRSAPQAHLFRLPAGDRETARETTHLLLRER